ncbi:IS66 family insertion sequence element accessory protein TnpA, partial [Agathobaculum desmolans]|uniref:IS66 family insertion sequence element accessory protein TnpA n=1 Tax=Agathobaculum desmolans TaxID=39484 RepID=UPI0038B2AB4A
MSKELTIQTLGQRQRLLEWSQKVAECRSSGMSVKRWCSENGTTPKTYYSWQKKV